MSFYRKNQGGRRGLAGAPDGWAGRAVRADPGAGAGAFDTSGLISSGCDGFFCFRRGRRAPINLKRSTVVRRRRLPRFCRSNLTQSDDCSRDEWVDERRRRYRARRHERRSAGDRPRWRSRSSPLTQPVGLVFDT